MSLVGFNSGNATTPSNVYTIDPNGGTSPAPGYAAPPQSSAGTADAAQPAAATSAFYQDEGDFLYGSDNHIYQREREGFRTKGWRDLGTDPAAAAQTAGMDINVLQSALNTARTQQQQALYQQTIAANGKTNQQNQLDNQTLQQQYDASKLAFSQGQGPNPGETVQDYQQKLQLAKDVLSGRQTSYDAATFDEARRLQDQQRQLGLGTTAYDLANLAAKQAEETGQRNVSLGQTGYDLATAANGRTNQQNQQQLQTQNTQLGTKNSAYDLANWDAAKQLETSQRGLTQANVNYDTTNLARDQHLKDLNANYGTQETQYNLDNLAQQHQVQNMQRNYQQSDYGWKLAHQAQSQAQDTVKLNQTGIEQGDASRGRSVDGYGYSSMVAPARLSGQ